MELSEALHRIGTLPYSVREFLPATEGEKLAHDLNHNYHLALSHWLASFLLGNSLNIQIVEEYFHVEPFAQMWKARFELLVGLVPRNPFFCFLYDGSPVPLWFSCIAADAVVHTRNYATQNVVTRKSFSDENLKTLQNIELRVKSLRSGKLEIKNAREVWDAEHIWFFTLSQAISLSDECDHFNSNYFEPWLKAERRSIRSIQMQKDAAFMYVLDGELKFVTRGKRKRKQM